MGGPVRNGLPPSPNDGETPESASGQGGLFGDEIDLGADSTLPYSVRRRRPMESRGVGGASLFANLPVTGILDTRREPLEYSSGQREFLQRAEALVRAQAQGNLEPNRLVVAGFAGTGKTTAVENIILFAEQFGISCGVLAPTNKAVEVLRGKLNGVLSEQGFSTIHAALMDPSGQRSKFEMGELDRLRMMGDVVIIDEFSMVPLRIQEHILRAARATGVKLIILGDNFQLRPIENERGQEDRHLLSHPDLLLTEVRRQAADSGILSLATAIRVLNQPIIPTDSSHDVSVLSQDSDTVAYFCEKHRRYDGDAIYIVASNESRVELNRLIREELYGATLAGSEPLIAGERLISISNNSHFSNGSTFVVQSYTAEGGGSFRKAGMNGGSAEGEEIEYKKYVVRDLEGKEFRLFLLPDCRASSVYNSDIPELSRRARGSGRIFDSSVVVATRGNAITAHKSQGGQWRFVLVEPTNSFGRDPRWNYTADTRASEELGIVNTDEFSGLRLSTAEIRRITAANIG